MQIRDDIYPKLKNTPLWTREGELERRINQAFNTLERFFETTEEVAKYVNNFQERKHAELFLDACSFYNISKSNPEHPFLKFIMMISTLEKVSSPEHKSFKDWLVSGGNKALVEEELDKLESPEYESFKEMVENLFEEYIEKFGALRNLRQFLWENFEEEEKIQIVKSFRTRKQEYVESIDPKTAKNLRVWKSALKSGVKKFRRVTCPAAMNGESGI